MIGEHEYHKIRLLQRRLSQQNMRIKSLQIQLKEKEQALIIAKGIIEKLRDRKK